MELRQSSVLKVPMSTAAEKPIVVFVLGGPGSGKGTQSKRIEEEFGFHHISAGDCLREEKDRRGSQYGSLIAECIAEGKIVPVAVTCALLRQKMQHFGWHGGRFLIDGFPRNYDNLAGWDSEMNDQVITAFCLHIRCTAEEMQRRVISRGATSQRTDDNMTSLAKRFETFRTATEPIIRHFEQQGLMYEIDGERSVIEVYNDIAAVFRRVLGGAGRADHEREETDDMAATSLSMMNSAAAVADAQ